MTIFFAELYSMIEILVPICRDPEDGVRLMDKSRGVHSAALQFSQPHTVAGSLGRVVPSQSLAWNPSRSPKPHTCFPIFETPSNRSVAPCLKAS
jgi:hypothetical protein